MQLNPPLAAYTDLDDEHGTLDVNKCDDDDAPWIVAKREKDAEEREARAMMAKKSAEASLLKAEAAKRREKNLKAKADAKRKKAQMLTAVAEKAKRRKENESRRKSFQNAAAAEYRGPSASFGETGETNDEEDEAAYALLAALKGGDGARDAALYSRRSEPPRKIKPRSERRPVETVGESHGRAAKPRTNRRCMQCSTCQNPRLKKRCLGREEGFIVDEPEPEPEPARNEEDENSPEKLLEEVERDLNTVVFPQQAAVFPQEVAAEVAARAAHIARLQESLAMRNAESASMSMPPPVRLRHSVRPPFVNNEEEPLRHDVRPPFVNNEEEPPRHDVRPPFVNNEEEPPRHDMRPQIVDNEEEPPRHDVRPPFVNNEEEPPRHDMRPQIVDNDDEEKEEPTPKRKRGRPPGSKSKPKPGTAPQPQHHQQPPPINAPVNNQPVNDQPVVTTPPSGSDVDELAHEPAVRPVPGLHGADRWDVNPLTGVDSATGRVISDVFAGGRPSSWLVRLLASYMATDKLGRQRMCVIIAALEERQHNFAERLIHDLNLEAQPGKSGDPIVAAWTYRLLQYAYVRQGEREGDALKAGEIAEKMEREIRAAQEQHSWNNITGHGGELPVGGWRTSEGSRPTAIATAGSAGAVGIVFDLIMSGIVGKRPTKEDWARISHNAHAIAMQHPNDALILQLYGGLLWRRGEMRAASMVLMKAYQHDGQQARAAPWAFETLLLMGDKEGATAMYERVHRFNPAMSLRLKKIAESTISAVEARGPWPESLQDQNQQYHPGAIERFADRGRV